MIYSDKLYYKKLFFHLEIKLGYFFITLKGLTFLGLFKAVLTPVNSDKIIP